MRRRFRCVLAAALLAPLVACAAMYGVEPAPAPPPSEPRDASVEVEAPPSLPDALAGPADAAPDGTRFCAAYDASVLCEDWDGPEAVGWPIVSTAPELSTTALAQPARSDPFALVARVSLADAATTAYRELSRPLQRGSRIQLDFDVLLPQRPRGRIVYAQISMYGGAGGGLYLAQVSSAAGQDSFEEAAYENGKLVAYGIVPLSGLVPTARWFRASIVVRLTEPNSLGEVPNVSVEVEGRVLLATKLSSWSSATQGLVVARHGILGVDSAGTDATDGTVIQDNIVLDVR